MCIVLAGFFRLHAADQSPSEVVNVERWPDNNGQHINAHGGGVLVYDGAYYLFGEHKVSGKEGNVAHVGVHCYRSTDLLHWSDEGVALAVSRDPDSDIVKECVIERPKVIYNPKTKKFVMWFHLEMKGQEYKAARAGVAVADRVTGPYTFVRSFRANPGVMPTQGADEDPKSIWRRDLEGGQMSRDMTLFVDDDGKAYHITSSEENTTLHVHELTDDFLGYSGRWARILPGKSNEAPALVKQDGRYWMITSGCTGWGPNAARSAVADHPFGPWTELGNPASGYNAALNQDENSTFGGQSTCIIPVIGKKGAYVALFDVWRPNNQEDSRYIMLPMRFVDGRLQVSWMPRWSLDVFDHMPPREPKLTSTLTTKGIAVELTAQEPGVSLRFTNDGSQPTASSPLWTGPVTIPLGTKLFAVAEKGGILSAPVRPNSPGWVAQPPPPTAYLEDLPTTAAQAAKPVQQGKSVGGTPLTVKGTVFPHGLGVQAPTSLTYALDPAWARFVARVGYDDEAVKASEGSVIASVRIDGKVVAVTPRVDKTNRFSYLNVLIPPGSKTLDIVTEPGTPGEPPGSADWIYAGFTTSRR